MLFTVETYEFHFFRLSYSDKKNDEQIFFATGNIFLDMFSFS